MRIEMGQVRMAVEDVVDRAVREREQQMLRELLQALNQFDGAQPHPPAHVWYKALADVRALASRPMQGVSWA